MTKTCKVLGKTCLMVGLGRGWNISLNRGAESVSAVSLVVVLFYCCCLGVELHH